MTKISTKIPYGYWIDRRGKLYPVFSEDGHTDVALDILKDRFIYILEMGYIRTVNETKSKTVYFEYGNTTRPSVVQMKMLRHLAQDFDYKLVSDNTGRQVDVCESRVKLWADELAQKTASGTPSWRSRYPLPKNSKK